MLAISAPCWAMLALVSGLITGFILSELSYDVNRYSQLFLALETVGSEQVTTPTVGNGAAVLFQNPRPHIGVSLLGQLKCCVHCRMVNTGFAGVGTSRFLVRWLSEWLRVPCTRNTLCRVKSIERF